MHKPLALFDVDKTLFNGISYFPLVEAQVEDGLVDATTLDSANACMGQYKTGEISYEDFVRSLLDIYANGLKGRPVDEVTESTGAFFDTTDEFFGFARPTVDMLRDTHELTIVTGGTQITGAAVGKVLGIPAIVSSIMEVQNNRVTGKMTSYLATGDEKKQAIGHLTEAHPYSGSMGFGDSEGDIDMLRAVEHAVCIRPTPGLLEVATQEGWAVVESDADLAASSGLAVVRRVMGSN